MMKHGIAMIVLAGVATLALGDLQLKVDLKLERGRRIGIYSPVEEDSDFDLPTLHRNEEFLVVTGHVGRIVGPTSNRTIDVVFWYDYDFGASKGSGSGSSSNRLDIKWLDEVPPDTTPPRPVFTVLEVEPPASRYLIAAERPRPSGTTTGATSNKADKTAQHPPRHVR
jgi:hypothetical protein